MSEVGTLEGITSVSNDAFTQLLVWRVILEPEAKRVADANDLAGFDGDVSANFALDFEQVLRGERQDGPPGIRSKPPRPPHFPPPHPGSMHYCGSNRWVPGAHLAQCERAGMYRVACVICSCVGGEGCQIGGRMHQEVMVALFSMGARKALAARADDAHSYSGSESVRVHAGAGAYDHVDATGRK